MRTVLIIFLSILSISCSQYYEEDITESEEESIETKDINISREIMKLLDNREDSVYINNNIKIEDGAKIIEQLRGKEHDGSVKKIYLIINSNGGSTPVARNIINYINNVMTKKVVCLIKYYAYSSAAIITSLCPESYAYRNADFMLHFARSSDETVDVMDEKLDPKKYYIKILFERIAIELGLTLEQFNNKIRNEWWLSAQEALEWGIIDGYLEDEFDMELEN